MGNNLCQCGDRLPKQPPNPFLTQSATILAVKPQTAIDITYRVASVMQPESGQFVQVSLPKVGEAPISISDFGEGYLELTIRKVGRLTTELAGLTPGDTIYIRGPYGKGFPKARFKGKELIIAAGGTGLAPVKSLINYYYTQPDEILKLRILLGFKTPQDILFQDEIALWQQKFDTRLTVDTGSEAWTGRTGLITQLVPEVEIIDIKAVEAVIVGPPPMMKYTIAEFLKRGLPKEQIWLSMERKMSCGIGKCGHCKIHDTYVCVDGPVFNYAQAVTLID